MFGLSIETMFALTLVVQGLILAFLILNIRVFGQALQMIDCIHDMVHDIDMLLKENKGKITGDVIRAIVVLSQMNAHIWYNESQVRKGEKGSDNLMLTHGLNGIRNTAINKIMEVVGGRKDYKVDCIAAEFEDWEVSW